MKKPFSSGILIGRFQTLHAGHERMINTCLELCSRTTVFVGSSQESGTEKNPFSFETRELMLSRIFGERIGIFPLPDIGAGNTSAWGEYLLSRVEACLGALPDLMVTGKEARRIDWFDGTRGQCISELYIPKAVDISASRMRQLFVNNEYDKWRAYTNPLLWDMYGLLRVEVLASVSRTQTQSI